jgi:hypothetical protein
MMDMNKLDIVDRVLVDNIYRVFVENKRKTGFIPMHNKPINAECLDAEILGTDENYVNLIIELSLMMHDGPTKGDFAFMDIIYTIYNDEIIVCASYQQKHQEYIALRCNNNTILINGFKDEEQYFKLYTLINIHKDLYYLQ